MQMGPDGYLAGQRFVNDPGPLVHAEKDRIRPDPGKFPDCRGVGKPANDEIGTVNRQNHRGLIGKGREVILPGTDVRCADLHEAGAGLLKNLRDPESTPDLHLLSPVYNDLPVPGKGLQDKKNRRSVIVYDQGVLRPHQP